MAKRYIPHHPTSTGKAGYNEVFAPHRTGLDGSVGYSYDEVKHLGKAMLDDAFRVVEFSGDGVVETATAAPGEKRSVTKKKTKAKTKFTVEDGTVPEVIEFAEEHPEAVDALLAAEKASDKPRKGIVGAAVFEDASAPAKTKTTTKPKATK